MEHNKNMFYDIYANSKFNTDDEDCYNEQNGNISTSFSVMPLWNSVSDYNVPHYNQPL